MARLLLILFVALAVEGAEAPKTPTKAEEKPTQTLSEKSFGPRLSWGPYEFLKQGLRNAPWVNDPFFPEARAFRLQGLVSDEMAFINGQWYRLGDNLDGYVVKSIRPEGVTLTKRTEVLLLKIKE